MKIKMAFIDRDGTIVREPEDFQVDRLDKIRLVPGVIPALLQLKKLGYTLVMVSNQDGLGTDLFAQEDFDICHKFILDILESQGVVFDSIEICPHLPNEGCGCRKPERGLVEKYLPSMDGRSSFVVGDRDSDLELADRMGIRGYKLEGEGSWDQIVDDILSFEKTAQVFRKTKETEVSVQVQLNGKGESDVATGLHFFDHMLEQLSKHSGISLTIRCQGDLQVDEHHTVEDVALVLGEALNKALGDRRGLGRYGFVLPMDESLAQVALDLSGRPYFKFSGRFMREKVGDLPTEMVPHFFRSLVDTFRITLHMEVEGENTHHMVESCFKALGRALREATKKVGEDLPSTKGVLG